MVTVKPTPWRYFFFIPCDFKWPTKK